MLNELLVIERGLRQAGIAVPRLHPHVKSTRRVPTLVVRLDGDGQVAWIGPLPADVGAWTLRDGQQNSFPFIQPKVSVFAVEDASLSTTLDGKKPAGERRTALLDLIGGRSLNPDAPADWFRRGLILRLRERQRQVPSLPDGHDAQVLWTTVERFLRACDPKAGGDPARLLKCIADRLLAELQDTADAAWVEVATTLLVGRRSKRGLAGGAVLFDALGMALPIYHVQVREGVIATLPGDREDHALATCALTGEWTERQSGAFPQANLPVLGPTYLFAKNDEIPANRRYGRVGTEAITVGREMVARLGGALEVLTETKRENITWRSMPSEGGGKQDLLLALRQGKPGARGKSSEGGGKQDLLLAFVEGVPEAPVTELLTEDWSREEDADPGSNSVALFKERTRRLIAAVQGRLHSALLDTHVQLFVLRSVDRANRKVVHADTPTVADLHRAAAAWSEGEMNFPDWLTLPLRGKRQSPPHLAPLGLIAFSRLLFVRRGTELQKVAGLPAAEALRLFFDPVGSDNVSGRQRVQRWLRLALTRRSSLLAGTAEALRRPAKFATAYDRREAEALRTITFLAVLLHKLNRDRRVYMNGAPFKLGQLLAAADMVHAGYCADIRQGSVPPALLGNQVFAMAQTAPAKALAVLCRRWKPYGGWAKKAARDHTRSSSLIKGHDEKDKQRGWDIKKALRHARAMPTLAAELVPLLQNCRVDDTFRAELLLGYIAGIPPGASEAPNDQAGNELPEGQEV